MGEPLCLRRLAFAGLPECENCSYPGKCSRLEPDLGFLVQAVFCDAFSSLKSSRKLWFIER